MALDDMIAWWSPSRDDSGNGTTTLNDLSGNGFDGTLTNMDEETDWVADTAEGGVRALELDGSNDFVAIAGTLWNSTGPVTFAFWQYVSGSHNRGHGGTGTDSGNDRFTCHVPWGDGNIYWDYGDFNVDGRISYGGYSSGGYFDKWTHVCLTSAGAAGSAMAILLDGVSKATTTASDGPSGAVTNFTLGSAVGNLFLGKIDDIVIYDRVLASEDITTLASARAQDLLASSSIVVPTYYQQLLQG